MKFKKNILKLSIIAGILACVLVAGSMFAYGTEANDKLNIIVTVPSTPVAENATFVAVVKVTNNNIANFKLAGLQVELAFDSAKLSATAESIEHTLDEEVSTAVSNVTSDGVVRFVCVKNTFTEEEGYTALTNLFKVTFTAKEAISNPAKLFDNNDITYLMGDTSAMEIVNSDSIYGADKEAIALAILNSDLELVVTKSAGTVVVAPTPEDKTALTKTELEATLGDDTITITDNNSVIGTGSKITTSDGTEAEIVVKGDLDGDGVVTVFDAMIIKKAIAEGADAADTFADKATQEYAGDVDDDALTNKNDSDKLLTHVVGNQKIG